MFMISIQIRFAITIIIWPTKFTSIVSQATFCQYSIPVTVKIIPKKYIGMMLNVYKIVLSKYKQFIMLYIEMEFISFIND